MQKREKIIVETGAIRLDHFLAQTEAAISRSHWKTLILEGGVEVNGCACKPNQRLKAGDCIEWSIPEERDDAPGPEVIPLDILFEDNDLLVLNKPAGMVVHTAPGHASGTLENALMYHAPQVQELERAGIVHRLDKDTSGIMVTAKTADAMEVLQQQFKARETKKQYWALVGGLPPASGRIDEPIGRHPVRRKQMAVRKEGGRTAITHYEVAERFKEATLLSVRIETGRTHQIRVHLAHLGHPVLGDSVYGGRRKKSQHVQPERQMLHAARLEFTHPSSGKRLSFEAPLPNDMQACLAELRAEMDEKA